MLKVCSRRDGSKMAGVSGSSKYANVKHSGVWCNESGTGARSDGGCYS